MWAQHPTGWGGADKMLIAGTGGHLAPRWMNCLRRVIVSVYAHSWG